MPNRNAHLSAAIAFDGRPTYELAALAKINPNTLSGICTGRWIATPEQQRRIADVLNRTVDELFLTEALSA